MVPAEGVAVTVLVVGYVLWWLVHRLSRSRSELRIATPLAIGFGLRLFAIAAIGLTGLEQTLRGGDENTFLSLARFLAKQPFGHGWLPNGRFQLHTVLFGLEDRLGFMTVGAMRVVQVGLALIGVVLIVAAVYDLAGARASRLAAWVIALEPASIFFNSALHKEPNMELASGLVVFGGTMLWKRLDVRGIVLFAIGGFIAVGTRSYAGWFLVSAAALILLHAFVRRVRRASQAIPVLYAVVIAGFLITPTLLAATSGKNLKTLQQSQTAYANSTGTGSGGANTDNLKLEKVDFSSRGQVLVHLPQRIWDIIVKPPPWQLGDTNQRFGAIGTLVAYALLLFFIRYAWVSRGQVFARAGPVLYPLLFLLVAYALASGNAGTGFRYRTHLLTLMVAAVAILREQALLVRAARRAKAPGSPAGPDTGHPPEPLPSPA
jgi:hypothetical protein